MTDAGAIGVVVVVAAVSVVVVAVALWAGWVTLSVVLRLATDGGSAALWQASFGDVRHAVEILTWSWAGRSVDAPSGVPESAVGADIVVVMLHGTAADGTCMRRWAEAVRDVGIEAPVVSPDHGRFLRDPAIHGERIVRFVRRVIELAPQARLVMVAHSMGGVALRHALLQADDIRQRVIGAVTVATPHQGTALAARFPMGPLRSLAWQSPTLQSLPVLEALVPRVRSFASDVDVIVYPPATCEAGVHELIVGVGHAALLTDAAVARRVGEAVKAIIVDAGRLPC
jgi:pimeloyl-ACP methyl ester carboxylesterase